MIYPPGFAAVACWVPELEKGHIRVALDFLNALNQTASPT